MPEWLTYRVMMTKHSEAMEACLIARYKNHVFEGDCAEIMRGFPDAIVSCCITDPPYNYEFVGHKWDDEEINRRLEKTRSSDSKTLVKNIPYGSGLAGGVRNKRWYERNRENILDYEKWCAEWAAELFRICKPGASVVVFNSTRTVAHVQVALERVGFYARDIVVYRRTSGIPKGINIKEQLKKRGVPDAEAWDGWHSCLRGEWEAVCVVQKPLLTNYIETAMTFGTGLFYTKTSDGGFQSNILEDIPREQTEEFNIHCTVKPLPLMRKLVEIFAPRHADSLVLDPFAGSGTTLLAAKEAGLAFVGIEVEPRYVEICQKRLVNDAHARQRPAKQRASVKQEMPLFDFSESAQDQNR
jgi:site-specific DNA-methyltransferase (adenine-specific)